MIIDCTSDLHGFYPELEGGDLLIIAGDLTKTDTEKEYWDFFEWLSKQKYKKIVVVAGNHDNLLDKGIPYSLLLEIEKYTYLLDKGTEFEGIKIWGSPWTKSFEGMNPKCKAFTVDHDLDLAKKWELIPDDVDIVVTHCSPKYCRDQVFDYPNGKIINAGSASLYDKIGKMGEKDGKKRILICGHIHEGYGTIMLSDMKWDKSTWTIINASHVDEHYKPVNKPVRIIL